MAKEFVPRFEEAEGDIRQRQLERISDEWRKEPGDFIYDAVAATPAELKQLQVNQDTILKNAYAQYAEDEYLDEHLYHVGLSRMQATQNQRQLAIVADAGVVIPEDYTISQVVLDEEGSPLEWTANTTTTYTEANQEKIVAITSKDVGAKTNVPEGTEFILLPPIPGVKIITDLGTTVAARDTEGNESARMRYDYRVKHPDTGGNKHDYVRWASEVEGVGKSKTIPRWNGNLTVKVVIVDANYEPASPALVNEVQNYLDPNSEGLGEGKAPMGAKVTVVAATPLPIDIAANVTYFEGVDPATEKAAFEQSVRDYLKQLVFTGLPIAYNKIGAMLGMMPNVVNYTDLTLNGATVDITPSAEAVATLGAVNI